MNAKLTEIDSGVGPIFTDPDPDEARKFFRKKSRKMTNKLMDLREAVDKFVHDGDYLAIGGFGANRTPVAACHEIVRQKKKNLAFAGHTSTHDMQILSAGKVYNKLDIAYIIGLEARGLSKCSKDYIQSGKVEICEGTNYALAMRLRAAAMGIPFIIARNTLGTDTFRFNCGKTVECPFTGKKVLALPALYPDVSFIHVHEADVYGNARFKGIAISDIDLANASKRLIITCERLIPNDSIRNDPTSTQIPFFLADAVCEVPFGAYPGTMPYEYFSDEDHLKEWLAAEKEPDKFSEFLKRNIYDCSDHMDYININGGMEKIKKLRSLELMLHKEDNNG